MTSPHGSGWESALADFEDKIALAETALREGEPLPSEVLQPFEPPTGLGPFPPELLEWATAILQRNAMLTRDLGDAMVVIETELVSTKKETVAARGYAPTSRETVSKFFDRGA